MKKVIVGVLCVALISIVLVGCNKDKHLDINKDNESTPTDEYIPSDTVEDEIKADEAEKAKKPSTKPPQDSKPSRELPNSIPYRYFLVRTDGSGFASPSATLCKSLDEITDYQELISSGYDIGEETNQWSFSGFIQKYDESFLEENAVLFILLDEENSNVVHRVSGVGMEDSDLIVDIIRENVDQLSSVGAQWNIVLELPKTVADAENFIINLM